MTNPTPIEHSTLSFSGRKRWAACPASVAKSINMPDNASSFAAEGTAAHAVAEFYVRQRFALEGAQAGECADVAVPDGFDLGDEVPAQWNERLRKHGRAYADFIASLIPEGAQAFGIVEQKVSIPSISTRLFGTADCLVWIPSLRLLIVVDYKFGRVDVEVGDENDTNAQLAAYAVAALETFSLDAGRIAIGVFQPNHPLRQPRKYVEFDAQPWLTNERNKIANEVAATVNPGAPMPGEHCRYCKGAPRCERFHEVFALIMSTADASRSMADLTDAQALQAYTMRGVVKAFWEDLEQRIKNMAKQGNPLIDVKTTDGALRYKDKDAAAMTLAMIGRYDLLQPKALSESLDAIPADVRADLIERSAPRKSFRIVGAGETSETVKALRKAVKGLDAAMKDL